VRWFFSSQLRGARRAVRRRDGARLDAAVAELRGGVGGLLGTYGRSRRRSRRRKLAAGNPTVAILPWGDVVEDYIEPIGLSLDDYAERLSGGWLFGFVEAFRRADVDTVVVCWSRTVTRPTRRTHVPTGATLWFLPPSAAYRAARARLADPYAWDRGRRWATGRRPSRRARPPGHPVPDGDTGGAGARPAGGGLPRRPLPGVRGGPLRRVVALGRVLRVPVFATFQGGDHTRTPVERRVRGRTVRAASGLVVAAAAEAARVQERYGVPPERIAAIANPFDPATLPLTTRAEARAALGLDDGARVAMWHGRVDVVPKGIDTLVEAWSEVRATCSTPPTLLLLGTGSGAGLVAGRASRSWGSTTCAGGTSTCSTAGSSAPTSRPPTSSCSPRARRASRWRRWRRWRPGCRWSPPTRPGVRAVVGDGEAAGGVVVPREDASALAAELRRFLDDPELSVAVGTAAARRVAEELSLDAVGRQLRRLVIGSRGTSGT
jgi:starch synthase